MKLIKSTHIILAFAMAFTTFTNAIPTTFDKQNPDNSLPVGDSEASIIPTGVYVPDLTACPSGLVPTYTNPKGGEVDCGTNGAGSDAIPVMFLGCAVLGCVAYGVIRARV